MQDSETPLNSSSWKLTTADKLNIGKKTIYAWSFPGHFFSKIWLVIINSYVAHYVRICSYVGILGIRYTYTQLKYVEISDFFIFFLVLQDYIYHM